jgi:hypothetical protein
VNLESNHQMLTNRSWTLIFSIFFGICLVQWRLPLPGKAHILPISTVVFGAVVLIALIQFHRGMAQWRPGWWPGAMMAALALGFLGMTRSGLTASLVEFVQYIEIYIVSTLFFSLMVRLGNKQSVFAGLTVMHGVALVLIFVDPGGVGLSPAKHAMFLIVSLPFWLQWLSNATDRLWQCSLIALEGAAFGMVTRHAGFLLVWAAVAVIYLVADARRPTSDPPERATRFPAPALVAAILLAMLATLSVRPNRPSPWTPLKYRYDAEHIRRFYVEGHAALLAPRILPFGGGPGHYRETINALKLRTDHQIHPDDMTVLKDGNSQYAVMAVENGFPAVLFFAIGIGLGAWGDS